MNSLPARTALVTGAGSGLGQAIARGLAEDGYRVAVCDIDADRAVRTHQELERRTPGGMVVHMDVTNPAGWEKAHEAVLREWGGLHVLVNNAGVAAAGNCADTSIEDWSWILEVDLLGVIRGCHKMLPVIQKTAKRDGFECRVVNVASFAGLAGMAGIAAYGTAKAAVIALSEQLRAELYGRGVGVTVVCPAFVQTRLLETFRSSNPASRQWVEKRMAGSGVTADDVAHQTLQAIRNRRFMVLTHPKTRTAWRIKRWFPEFYFRQICKAQKSSQRSPITEPQA